MSGLEQTFAEEIENNDITPEPEDIPTPEDNPEPQLSEAEERALNDGWMPKEDWVSKGRDSDDWVSAKKFNERGELMGALKANQRKMEEMERSFDDRLKANQKLHEIQTKAMRADLERRRDEAVETADTEAFRKVQAEIDDLNDGVKEVVEPKTPENPDQLILDNYNKANPWLYEGSPKAAYAQQQFGKYNSQGLSAKEAIDLMEADLKRHFPDVNPNRDNALPTERNRSKPSAPRKQSLKWSDLTPDEVKWFEFGEFKNKDEYLKIIEDDRKSRG